MNKFSNNSEYLSKGWISSWIGVKDVGKLSTACYGLKLLESYPEEHESLLIFP